MADAASSSTPTNGEGAVDLGASFAEAQGIEIVSESDLMGIDPDAGDEPKGDEPKGDEPKGDEPKGDEPKGDEPKGDEPKGDEPKGDEPSKKGDEDSSDGSKPAAPKSKEDGKPPKGYVPLEAVKEVRSENRFLKDQINSLTSRIDNLLLAQQTKGDAPAPDFKVLSETEFKALADENPAEALVYMQQLNQYNDAKREEDRQNELAEASSEFVNRVITDTNRQMEEIAPGIFDDDSGVQADLVNFANELGFSDDLFYLTNPETQIILPGDTEPVLLGDQAASILKVLVTAKTQLADANTKVENSKVDEAALIEKLRAEVEAEVLKKFKESKGGDFKSLKQIPKSDAETEFGDKILTEAQLSKLSDAERDAYLAGA